MNHDSNTQKLLDNHYDGGSQPIIIVELTMKDLAALFDVKTETIRAWICSGRLPLKRNLKNGPGSRTNRYKEFSKENFLAIQDLYHRLVIKDT